MWALDHKKGWVLKNWCLQTVESGKTLESALDCKIKPINPKGNQPWIFVGRTVKAKALTLWPPDAKSQLTGKDPDSGKDWRQNEKRASRGEDGYLASPAPWTWVWANSRRWWRTGKPGVWSQWGCKESATTQQLNNNNRPSLGLVTLPALVLNLISSEYNLKSIMQSIKIILKFSLFL